MQCKYCLAVMNGKAKFCENCGQPAGKTDKFCTECGAKASATSKFCEECGGKFSVETFREQVGESTFERHSQVERTVKPFRAQGEKLLHEGFPEEAQGMFKSGIHMLDARFADENSPSYHNARASLSTGMSNVYTQLGDNETALQWLCKARDELQGLADLPFRLQLAEIHQLIGWSHYRTGDMREAAMSYYHGLAILEDAAENKQGAMLYQGLGKLFRALGNSDDSLSYLKRDRQIRVKLGDDLGNSIASTNLGVLFAQMGDYAGAQQHYQAAQEISVRLNDLEGIVIGKANLGYVRYEQEDYPGASQLLENAVELAVEKWPWVLPVCYCYLARVAAAERNPEGVLHYVAKAHESCGEKIDPPDRAIQAELRALALFDQGDRVESFRFFEQAHELFESLNIGFDHYVMLLNYGGRVVEHCRDLKPGPKRRQMLNKAVDLVGRATDGFAKLGNGKYTVVCRNLLDTISKDFK
jgi:tetratricopeptide (TPR) repeat protein